MLVLVADDEKLIRWSLRQRFEREGHAVIEAADARTALERARGADAVIVDLDLPGADGLAVAAALHGQRPARPVILMTALASTEFEEAAYDRGVDHVVQKPFDLDELVELVRSAVGR